MPTVGLVVAWAGYALFVWGYTKVKSAYGGPGLTFSDVALPSHRSAYMNALPQLQGASGGNLGTLYSGPGASPGPGKIQPGPAGQLGTAEANYNAAVAQYGYSSPQATAAGNALQTLRKQLGLS